jgi:hypothetical protein
MLGGWVSYWMIPLFSAVVWLVMLIAMISDWATSGKPRYPEWPDMAASQSVPYISNIGAHNLKPLFITMGTISVVSFDIAFVAEQYLRSAGRLTLNSRSGKILAWFSILFAIAGGAGLVLLTIFDTLRHKNLHDGFIALFIGGYVVSACFTCAEYQRLGIRYREFKILRLSFWMKLAFILVELALAIAFGVLKKVSKNNTAAVVEWVIALVYAFYVASYAVDFRPATKTANGAKFHDAPRLDTVAMAQDRNNSGLDHLNASQGDRYQRSYV